MTTSDLKSRHAVARISGRAGLLSACVVLLATAACSVQPKPLTDAELTAAAQSRAERVVGPEQAPVTKPISLYEAMARAIKYNLDHQVELKQQALRLEELSLSTYDMLPNLVANADYTGRSNEPGGASISLLTNTPSLEPSRSTEKNVLEADLTLSWDILDFGISYLRSKQKGEDVMIALEQRRSAINRIVEDVRTAYWRVVSAQRLVDEIDDLDAQVTKAIAGSEVLISRRVVAPMPQLAYQRDLLETKRDLGELRRDLRVAKRQLAALTNLPIGSDFEIVMPEREPVSPTLELSVEDMLFLAQKNRPELREISYRLRKSEIEGDIAILEALPNIRVFLAPTVSTNDLLFNTNWVGWGAQVSWNLLNLGRLPQRQDTIEAGKDLLDTRALALTQAVATQVLVSRMRFESLREELITAEKYRLVQGRITAQTEREFRAGRSSEQAMIEERQNLILADLRYDVAYADMQNAFANLYASIGLDAYDADLTGRESVGELSQALEAMWRGRGDLSLASPSG